MNPMLIYPLKDAPAALYHHIFTLIPLNGIELQDGGVEWTRNNIFVDWSHDVYVILDPIKFDHSVVAKWNSCIMGTSDSLGKYVLGNIEYNLYLAVWMRW